MPLGGLGMTSRVTEFMKALSLLLTTVAWDWLFFPPLLEHPIPNLAKLSNLSHELLSFFSVTLSIRALNDLEHGRRLALGIRLYTGPWV